MSQSCPKHPHDKSSRDEALHVHRNGIVRDPSRESAARSLAIELARLLNDDKCTDILVLDLRGISQATDYFIVASGTSQRQMRSAGVHAEELAREHQSKPISHNLNEKDANWFVLDFVDVVVHIFEPETRTFYDLEMLWGDADHIEWQRPDASKAGSSDSESGSRNRAGLRPGDVIPKTRPPQPPQA